MGILNHVTAEVKAVIRFGQDSTRVPIKLSPPVRGTMDCMSWGYGKTRSSHSLNSRTYSCQARTRHES